MAKKITAKKSVKRGPGRPKKRPAIFRITVELPVSLVEEIDAEAEKRGCTRTRIMIERLERKP